jgi:alkylation response protein AidB-like acyl-CoA dehydrogenase
MADRAIFHDEHRAFRDSMRGFVDRTILPRLDEIADAHQHPRDIWLEAGRQGLLGLQVPEAYGGGGTNDYRFSAIAGEELARASAATASSFGIHFDVCAPYLVELSTADQKSRWLPGFCSGEIITAIAMTEPSAGSDLAALKTTAVRSGTDWVING